MGSKLWVYVKEPYRGALLDLIATFTMRTLIEENRALGMILPLCYM